jgi:hypothetical protein
MTIETGIDLNTCVPGQKVELRCGKIVKYIAPIKDGRDTPYEHVIDFCNYMNDGCFWKDRCISNMDVIRILSLEEEESVETAPKPTHSITDQIDVTNPDHVSIIPHEHGVTISIKKGLTTISWRHYNS